MKFETISGTKYDVYEKDGRMFLRRDANHPIKNIRYKKIKSTNSIVYHLKTIPNIVVGKSAIIEVEDEVIEAFETTTVTCVSL